MAVTVVVVVMTAVVLTLAISKLLRLFFVSHTYPCIPDSEQLLDRLAAGSDALCAALHTRRWGDMCLRPILSQIS